MRIIRIKQSPRHVSLGVLPVSDMFDKQGERVDSEEIPTIYLDTDFVQGRPSRTMVKHTTGNGFKTNAKRRMVAYLTTCITEYTSMVTLTCPLAHCSGEQWKDAQSRFFKWALANMQKSSQANAKPPSIFWFLEFQESGRPHTHALINGWLSKTQLSEKWAEYWTELYAKQLLPFDLTPYDHYTMKVAFNKKVKETATRVELLKNGHEGASQYALKYAMKDEQKDVPAGFGWVGRFWGIVGCRAKHAAVVHQSRAFMPELTSNKDKLTYFWLEMASIALNSSDVCSFCSWKYGIGVSIYMKSPGEKWNMTQQNIVSAFTKCTDAFS